MTGHKLTVAEKAKNTERRQSIRAIGEQFGDPPPYTSQPSSVQASSSNVGSEKLSTTTNVPFENLDFKPSPLELPTAAECIAHLKLLHAFAKVRHEIGNHEGLFGIKFEKFEDAKEPLDLPRDELPRSDSHQPEGVHGQDGSRAAVPNENENEDAALVERIREKRWTVFVTKAAHRFEKWWDSWYASYPIATTDYDSSGRRQAPRMFPDQGEGFENQLPDYLPPLDVLMVWHAYMLNPRAYLEDCMRWSKHRIWRTSFPWNLIHDSTDKETFIFHPSEEAIETFERATRLPWNILDDHFLKLITCPRCLCVFTVPWTRLPASDDREAVEAYLSGDTGFAGNAFRDSCYRCNLVVTHETLRVGKFIADASALHASKRPLPGTILNAAGMPQLTDKNKRISTHDPFFPNRVVENLSEFEPRQLRKNINKLSIETLKSMFQNAMASPSRVKLVNSEQYKTDFVAKESKIAVRKMLSHYWDNSSPFGLDLVGAVIRQGSFVLKMRRIDWLHSPSVMTTMQRLIVKYHRFVRIIADNPKKVAVPTLDVDLAWVSLAPSILSSNSSSNDY